MAKIQKKAVRATNDAGNHKPAIESIQILREISRNPCLSQRELAAKNRISLGKVNYALKSLLNQGHIKVRNFKNSKNKRQYAYFLTPAGMYEIAKRTTDFLQWKMDEHERIRREIRELEEDIAAHAIHHGGEGAADAGVSPGVFTDT